MTFHFSYSNIKKLEVFLFDSSVHDARIEKCSYDMGARKLFLEVYNPCCCIKTIFTFHGVEAVAWINGHEFGSSKTILSLTVEENYQSTQALTCLLSNDLNDMLYFLFQMFSGEEWHIVFKEVLIDIIK